MAESNAENVAPRVLGMLMKEQQGIAKTPIDGVRMIVNEEQVTDIQCEIMGPEGTPYENGVFRMKLVLGADFPASPPKVRACAPAAATSTARRRSRLLPICCCC